MFGVQDQESGFEHTKMCIGPLSGYITKVFGVQIGTQLGAMGKEVTFKVLKLDELMQQASVDGENKI